MHAAGRHDIARAASELSETLPEPLAALATIAYNYRWSWHPRGRDLFSSIDDALFARVHENPVRLLMEARPDRLERAAADEPLLRLAREVSGTLAAEAAAPTEPGPGGTVAFLCAEFGIHRSLHIYSGGLGVLAGDMLKEASDQRLPYVGVGLMYADGAFHQRIGPIGYQEDHWRSLLLERLPAAVVTGDDGAPVIVDVPLGARIVAARIWRVDVGRTPLFLLDAGLPENDPLDRWITSRLYVGDRDMRLEQYAMLGLGAIRALSLLGIEPAVVHLNEGHAALAPLELARAELEVGDGVAAAITRARARTVFTTHTPVPAGNETYAAERVRDVLGPRLAIFAETVERLGDAGEGRVGMTTLALRLSRTATGVSELHGRVSRRLWRSLFSSPAEEQVPIGSVTNGVHVPTWLGGPMRDLLDRHLGEGWIARADDPSVWQGVGAIPDAEMWAVRERSRAELVAALRQRARGFSLERSESRIAASAAERALDEDRLTIGFARRVATYKRLPLLYADLGRTEALLDGPHAVQFAIAGKAHPRDLEAKAALAGFFALPWADPAVGNRMTFVEDYDMSIAAALVAGCDVWLNVPRPPWEASGTSGMKAAVNGAVNVSILDGWWAEAFDGDNGFAVGEGARVEGVEAADESARDAADAEALYDTLERRVLPAFYERDADGIPTAWVAMMKASLTSVGPRFSAARMVRDYVDRVYPSGPTEGPGVPAR